MLTALLLVSSPYVDTKLGHYGVAWVSNALWSSLLTFHGWVPHQIKISNLHFVCDPKKSFPLLLRVILWLCYWQWLLLCCCHSVLALLAADVQVLPGQFKMFWLLGRCRTVRLVWLLLQMPRQICRFPCECGWAHWVEWPCYLVECILGSICLPLGFVPSIQRDKMHQSEHWAPRWIP